MLNYTVLLYIYPVLRKQYWESLVQFLKPLRNLLLRYRTRDYVTVHGEYSSRQ